MTSTLNALNMDKLWVSHSALNDMVNLANKHHPLETGGIMLGYIGKNGEGVVTKIIGPGPNAIHSRYGFTPDHEFQMTKLELAFEKIDGADDYLGDWHTHPDCSNAMSFKDKRTLTRIAKSTRKTLPNPYMVILGGLELDWKPGGYRFNNTQFGWFRFSVINKAKIKSFNRN